MLKTFSHGSFISEKRSFSGMLKTKNLKKVNVYSSLQDLKIWSVMLVEIKTDWNLVEVMF